MTKDEALRLAREALLTARNELQTIHRTLSAAHRNIVIDAEAFEAMGGKRELVGRLLDLNYAAKVGVTSALDMAWMYDGDNLDSPDVEKECGAHKMRRALAAIDEAMDKP